MLQRRRLQKTVMHLYVYVMSVPVHLCLSATTKYSSTNFFFSCAMSEKQSNNCSSFGCKCPENRRQKCRSTSPIQMKVETPNRRTVPEIVTVPHLKKCRRSTKCFFIAYCQLLIYYFCPSLVDANGGMLRNDDDDEVIMPEIEI